MSGRYRTVALQAVAVAIIAAFVFIAFLRPSEPGELAGIDAPGGEPSVDSPDPGDDKDDDDRGNKGKKGENGSREVDDRRGQDPNSGPRDSSGAGSITAVGAGTVTAVGAGTVTVVGTGTVTAVGTGSGNARVPATPPGGDDDPRDDQYTDLVSVLMKEVGDPALFREIDAP